MKLHLGCGNIKLEGFINCDISPEVNPDMIVDITKKLPFKSNSVDEVIMYHTLEHTLEPIKVLKEIDRICKKGAFVDLRVPYFSHESATSTLDHYHQFTYTSFDVLDIHNISHYQGCGRFHILHKKLTFDWYFRIFELFNLCPKLYQRFLANIIPARELRIRMVTI